MGVNFFSFLNITEESIISVWFKIVKHKKHFFLYLFLNIFNFDQLVSRCLLLISKKSTNHNYKIILNLKSCFFLAFEKRTNDSIEKNSYSTYKMERFSG